jgi:hypothetical protein
MNFDDEYDIKNSVKSSSEIQTSQQSQQSQQF